MSVRLAEILRGSVDALVASLPPEVHKAARAIVACRTSVLGGHAKVCADGHVNVWYNACRNRSCPRCSFYRVQRWLERQSTILLGKAHHHVIMTMPHDLNGVWLLNRRLMGDILFASAKGAIFDLCADPRYLGATPGAVMALHTWGQQLSFHPHVHCLVTAGGVDGEGNWRDTRRKFFLPLEPLKRLFRGKLLDAVRQRASKGELRLPDGWTVRDLERLTWRLHNTRWNVEVRERYTDPVAVLNYLGRYLHGGPIGESRLESFDGATVRFRYKDHRSGEQKTMPLSQREFVRRYLQHVAPEGFHMVRAFGLYRRGRQSRAVHAQRGQVPPLAPELYIQLNAHPRPTQEDKAGNCEICGKPIVVVTTLRPQPMRAGPAPRRAAA